MHVQAPRRAGLAPLEPLAPLALSSATQTHLLPLPQTTPTATAHPPLAPLLPLPQRAPAIGIGVRTLPPPAPAVDGAARKVTPQRLDSEADATAADTLPRDCAASREHQRWPGVPGDTDVGRGGRPGKATVMTRVEGASASMGAVDGDVTARRVARRSLLDVCRAARAHAPLQEQLVVIDSFVAGVEEELCAPPAFASERASCLSRTASPLRMSI